MNTALISPLVQIVLCLILLILIIIKSKLGGTATRVYFLFLIGITIQGLLIFLIRASSTSGQATEWHKWLWFEIPFLNALMLHFSLTISKRKLHISFVTFIYCIAVVFSIFSLRYMVISGIRGTLTDYQLIHGVAYYPSIVLSLAGMIFSTIIIWNYNKKSINAAERNRNSYIILGLIIYLVMMLIGGLDIWDALATPAYSAALVGNTAFCVLTTISIVKYHLLDVNLILRRSLAFIIMSLILAVPYSIFYMLADVQNRPRYLAFLIPLLILTALLFHPIWLQILKLIDRLFYSPQYNVRQYIKSSQINVYDITDINTLAKSIATIINNVFLTRGVHILTRVRSGNYVIMASSLETLPSLEISKENELIQLLIHVKNLHTRNLDNLFKSPGEEKQQQILNDLGIELLIPLKNRKEMLVGIILIGRKFNSHPYSQEDEHLISTLTRRLGPELDNARLYAIETGIRKDLEEQNRLKTNFLNKVAQELKIPLTNIIKSSESLNGYQKSKLNMKERLLTRNIQRGAWWLDHRVSELIDFASSKSNMIKLDIKPLNTRDLIINTTSQLEYIFINKGQNLHIDIEHDLPLILGDYDKLQQILFNLLSNANKYSPAGSKISVGAHNNNGSIVIEIGDSASIISDDEKTRIFEPYYRTKDENIRQNIPGLGLGLTISKKLIELQHGEINIRNNSSGNIFSVKIPIYNNQSDGKEE